MTAIVGASVAQTVKDEIAADPRKAGGVYYAYNYEAQDYTPAPKGYKPFYISHYGRHGSRWLLHRHTYEELKQTLDKAAEAGALTPYGLEVRQRYAKVFDNGRYRAGELSPLGVEQHRQIAERMYRNYPEILRKPIHIEAVATVYSRCILSMAAFSERLKELNPRLDITRTAGEMTTKYLNFYNTVSDTKLSPVYLDFMAKGDWRKVHNARKKEVVTDRFISALFADKEYASKIDSFDLMKRLGEVAADMQNVDAGVSFADLFTPDEMYALWEWDNYFYYVTRGPSPIATGHSAYYAKVLLDDIITRADRAIEAGIPTADLRFGHDGNIMSFTHLMRLKFCSAKVTDYHKVADAWVDYKVSPMAANLQLIFYRKAGSPETLVKFLYNEQEVLIELPTDTAPYYRWDAVRKYYRDIMESLRAEDFE